MGRKILVRKPTVEAPTKPNLENPEDAKGGKKRSRLFAAWLDQGLSPYEAYVKAGFQVKGVRGPSGELWETGFPVERAQADAERMAKSNRIQGWIACWNMPAEALLEQMKSESAFVLRKALDCRDESGNPTARAINAADSILDRTGLGRSSKVVQEHRNKSRNSQELADLRQDVIEAMRRDGLVIEVGADQVLQLEGADNERIQGLREDPALEPASEDNGED